MGAHSKGLQQAVVNQGSPPAHVWNLPTFRFNMICSSGNRGVHDSKMMAQEHFLRRVLKLCWGIPVGLCCALALSLNGRAFGKFTGSPARNLRRRALSMCLRKIQAEAFDIFVRAELQEPFLESVGLDCTIAAISYVNKHLGRTPSDQNQQPKV